MTSALRIDASKQGPTGFGQGGWTAQRFAAAIGASVTVAMRRPIPLDTDLQIVARYRGAPTTEPVPDHDEWHLVATDTEIGSAESIMVASAWTPDVPDTAPVSIADAALAGMRFPWRDEHPLPECFSCGTRGDSMNVRAGALDDGRWATDWFAPTWAAQADGTADPATLWAAVDCSQGWFAGDGDPTRRSLTAQLAVEQLAPIEPGAIHSIVAWAGDYDDHWNGRKRGTCGAVFDDLGNCVARSRAFWVSIKDS